MAKIHFRPYNPNQTVLFPQRMKPDFITINRFRNRVKKEINEVFTQTVLLLSSKGFISLNVEYIDGTKIESKANKYTFVWRKTVERNRVIVSAMLPLPFMGE